MQDTITKAFDALIERIDEENNADIFPLLSLNKDHSRTVKHSAVILADEIVDRTNKAYYYCTDTDSVSTYLYRYAKDAEYTQFHSHNFLEIAYVVKGKLRLSINDSITEFSEGELCIMDYSTIHAEKLGDGPVKVLYLSLLPELFDEIINSKKNPSFAQEFLQEHIQQKRNTYQFVHFIPGSDVKKSTDSILTILNELVERSPGAPEIILGHIIRLLHLLKREYSPRLSSAEKAQASRALYYDICNYIKENCRDIKISDLSDHFHYNANFFNRLIKEQSGVTYIEYLQKVRFERAEKLLAETDLPVTSVANSVGYHNIGYFYKIFSEKYGMLPAEYRKKNRPI